MVLMLDWYPQYIIQVYSSVYMNIPVLSLLSLSKASSIEEDIDLEKNRVHSSRVEGQKLLALINYILLY